MCCVSEIAESDFVRFVLVQLRQRFDLAGEDGAARFRRLTG